MRAPVCPWASCDPLRRADAAAAYAEGHRPAFMTPCRPPSRHRKKYGSATTRAGDTPRQHRLGQGHGTSEVGQLEPRTTGAAMTARMRHEESRAWPAAPTRPGHRWTARTDAGCAPRLLGPGILRRRSRTHGTHEPGYNTTWSRRRGSGPGELPTWLRWAFCLARPDYERTFDLGRSYNFAKGRLCHVQSKSLNGDNVAMVVIESVLRLHVAIDASMPRRSSCPTCAK